MNPPSAERRRLQNCHQNRERADNSLTIIVHAEIAVEFVKELIVNNNADPNRDEATSSFIPTFESAGLSRYSRAFADPTALAKFNDRVAEFQSGCARV